MAKAKEKAMRRIATVERVGGYTSAVALRVKLASKKNPPVTILSCPLCKKEAEIPRVRSLAWMEWVCDKCGGVRGSLPTT